MHADSAPDKVFWVQNSVHRLCTCEESLTGLGERDAVATGVAGINNVRLGEPDVVIKEHLND